MGSGSGQQIVTFVNDRATKNALWWIRPAHTGDAREYPPGEATCQLAEPVRCGQTVRLTHVDTMRNLHSHNVKSPLSSQQEVSAFGTGDAKGDAGDDWIVECSTKYWMRGAVVRLVSCLRSGVVRCTMLLCWWPRCSVVVVSTMRSSTICCSMFFFFWPNQLTHSHRLVLYCSLSSVVVVLVVVL